MARSRRGGRGGRRGGRAARPLRVLLLTAALAAGRALELRLPPLLTSSSGVTQPEGAETLKQRLRSRSARNPAVAQSLQVRHEAAHAAMGGDACSGCALVEEIRRTYDFFNLLDVGAGNCKLVRTLLGQGIRAKGIEMFSKPLHDFCGDLLLNGTVLNSGWTVSPMPYKPNSFDLVLAIDVLHYLPQGDLGMALAEIRRVARGKVLVVASRPGAVFPGARPELFETARPRQWWVQKFGTAGLEVDGAATKKLARAGLPKPVLQSLFALQKVADLKDLPGAR